MGKHGNRAARAFMAFGLAGALAVSGVAVAPACASAQGADGASLRQTRAMQRTTIGGVSFEPGHYSVKTTLVKADSDSTSMAAQSFADSAALEVAEDGSARLEINVPPLTVGAFTAFPDDIKVMQQASFDGPSVEAEELDPTDQTVDGKTYSIPSAVRFAIPAAVMGGNYIYLQLTAQGAPMGVQNVRLKVDYTQPEYIASVKFNRRSYAYTGKAITPSLTVKGTDGKVLKLGRDYKLSCSHNKKVGVAYVTVDGCGSYSGFEFDTFKIVAKKAAAPKVTAGKKKLTVAKWGVTGASKYQVQYRVKGGKWKTACTKSKPAKVTISKLKKGKKYQVRIVSLNGSAKVTGSACGYKKVK